MADAADLKSAVREGIRVRISASAPPLVASRWHAIGRSRIEGVLVPLPPLVVWSSRHSVEARHDPRRAPRGGREPADEAAHSSSEHFNDVSTRFRSLFESRTANGFMKRITPNISLSATWWMTVRVPFGLRL